MSFIFSVTEDFPSAGVTLERINNSPKSKKAVFDTRLAGKLYISLYKIWKYDYADL